MAFVHAVITGDKALDRALKKLGDSGMKTVLRAAVRKASNNVATIAKANAKTVQDTGALWRSIGVKSVTANKKTGLIIGIVGPRSLKVVDRKETKSQGKTVMKDRFKKDFAGRNPGKYAHLVEFGTKRGVREYKIFRNAIFGSESQHKAIAVAVIKGKLPAEIEKARKKSGGKR
jgi:HK97 gp10 family phage protein